MLRRIPNFVLWIFLAFTAATIPLACSSDDDDKKDSGRADTLTGS